MKSKSDFILKGVIGLLFSFIVLLIYYFSFLNSFSIEKLNAVISFFLAALLLYFVYKNYGLYSVPFLLCLFYIYPIASPFYSYVSDASYFKIYNKELQDNTSLVTKAQLYFLVSAIITVFTFHMLLASNKKKAKPSKLRLVPVSNSWSIVFSLLTLAMAYLSDPGGTILTHNYTQVIEGRIAGTEFAGGLFVLFWVLAFVNFQQGKQKKIFIIITILSVLWLLLHAKRSPVLGISFCFLFYLNSYKKMKVKHLIIPIVLVLTLFIVGEIRNTLSTTSSISFTIQEDTAALPGNGAGVFLTIMGAIHITDNIMEALLFGESYWNEIYGVIPSPLLRFLDLPLLPGYGYSVYNNYLYYQGGMHLLSPAYANFGRLGVVIISVILGFIIAYVNKSISSSNPTRRAHGYMLVMFFPAATWYNLMILLSWTIYFFSFLLIINLFISKKTFKHFR